MSEEKQVLVTFVTKLPQELHVPQTEVAVPASLKRYGLSQIINHLLALEPVRPFDFIIDGELLRKSLEQHLLEHNISPESVVEIEYVPAVVPPEPKSAIPQDDWVTAVAAAAAESCLASGSADGVVQLWNGGGDCLQEFSAHKGGVNALAAVAAASSHQQQAAQQHALLLSAGKDNTLRLWDIGPAVPTNHQQQNGTSKKGASSRSSSGAVQCVAEYRGHTEAVQAVAANPAGSLCCSGGWDGQLLLWRTGPAVVEEAASVSAGAEADDAAAGNRKKRRVAAANGSSPAAVGSAPLTLEHTASLSGHVHCVSAVCWPQPDTVFSGGWDHSVRRFDVESSTNTDTYNGSKAVYAVAAPADGSSNVVAFGGSDRVLRVWDTRRVSGEGLAVKAYTAHEGWISAVSWRPESSYQVATGGHDGAVKLWDIRTAVPLGSLQQHKEDAKVLCVGWWGGQTLVSGGSDCKVQLYSLP